MLQKFYRSNHAFMFPIIVPLNRMNLKEKKVTIQGFSIKLFLSINQYIHFCQGFLDTTKVIYPKYSKHLPYTVAYTIDCVCSKILNHGLIMDFFFHFSSLYKIIFSRILFGFLKTLHKLQLIIWDIAKISRIVF